MTETKEALVREQLKDDLRVLFESELSDFWKRHFEDRWGGVRNIYTLRWYTPPTRRNGVYRIREGYFIMKINLSYA